MMDFVMGMILGASMNEGQKAKKTRRRDQKFERSKSPEEIIREKERAELIEALPKEEHVYIDHRGESMQSDYSFVDKNQYSTITASDIPQPKGKIYRGNHG